MIQEKSRTFVSSDDNIWTHTFHPHTSYSSYNHHIEFNRKSVEVSESIQSISNAFLEGSITKKENNTLGDELIARIKKSIVNIATKNNQWTIEGFESLAFAWNDFQYKQNVNDVDIEYRGNGMSYRRTVDSSTTTIQLLDGKNSGTYVYFREKYIFDPEKDPISILFGLWIAKGHSYSGQDILVRNSDILTTEKEGHYQHLEVGKKNHPLLVQALTKSLTLLALIERAPANMRNYVCKIETEPVNDYQI